MVRQFLGLTSKEVCSYKKAEIVVVPVPFEVSVSYGKGTSWGPKAIIDASSQVELYDIDLDSEIYKRGVYTLPYVCGTSDLANKKNRAKIFKKIENTATKILKDEKKGVFLGGEHSITYPIVKAFKNYYKDIIVLHFDAHSDLRGSYEKDRLSHACVMKRVFDLGVEFVSIGIRSQCIEEAHLIKNKKLNIFYMKDICNNKKWIEKVISKLKNKKIYITFDVDFLDPSIMPATGTPEPGGFLWSETLDFIEKIGASSAKIVGFDFVELAPIKNNNASDFLAAKLIYKMIGYLL